MKITLSLIFLILLSYGTESSSNSMVFERNPEIVKEDAGKYCTKGAGYRVLPPLVIKGSELIEISVYAAKDKDLFLEFHIALPTADNPHISFFCIPNEYEEHTLVVVRYKGEGVYFGKQFIFENLKRLLVNKVQYMEMVN